MLNLKQNIGWLILAIEFLVAILGYFAIQAYVQPISLFGTATLSWEVLWGWLSFFYILGSIRIWGTSTKNYKWGVIPADKIAVRLIAGIATDSITAGPPIIPPGLGSFELFPTATAQREFPDEPEFIFRSTKDGDQNAPVGKTPPLRINFSDSLKAADVDKVLGPMDRFPEDGGLQWVWRPGVTSAEKAQFRASNTKPPVEKMIIFNPNVPDDGLSTSRITAEVSHISRLRIYDAVALVKTIAPDESTGDRLDEVFRQIEDEQTVALNSILTKISVAQAQANVDWMNAILFARVEIRIKAVDGHSDSWGIDLEGAALKPFGFNRSLNEAVTGVAEASFKAQATVRAAEATKKKLVLEGAGTATAARDLAQKTLEGKGKGLAAAAVATGLQAKELLGAEVAEKIGTGEGNVIIGDDGLAKLVGAGSAIANALPKKP